MRLITSHLPRPTRGVTLIELMVGLAVLALLLMSGAPAFSEWLLNTRIRSASESLLNGIQYARTEAVRRNTTTRFQLTDTLENGCVTSSSGRNWVVNIGRNEELKGKCDAPLVANDQTDAAPFLLQKGALLPANASITLTASKNTAVVAFNGLGQRTTVNGQPLEDVSITVSPSQGGCAGADPNGIVGHVRCLRVVLQRDGQARLCDIGVKKSSNARLTAC